MLPFEFHQKTRVFFGSGVIKKFENLKLEFRKPLLVADCGLKEIGHVDYVIKLLGTVNIKPVMFHDFDINPDTKMVERGRKFAAPLGVDSIIGLGGGSSLDCAQAINFLLTNGGTSAKKKWTASFNPIQFGSPEALELY